MRWYISLALLAALLPFGAPADAAPACARRDDVIKELANRYKEMPVSVALANNGGLLEVLTSGSGGTWTIIVTTPNGIACMVAAGEDWQQTVPVAEAGQPL